MQPVDWRTRRPGFQRRSCNGSHSNRSLASPAFGGCSFLRDGRAERHSAVQRSPRSHSSASLRSRSAVALSSWARARLRYRIARALLMASQIPGNIRRIQLQEKDLVPGSAGEPCRAAGFVFRSQPALGSPRTKPSPGFLESCRGRGLRFRACLGIDGQNPKMVHCDHCSAFILECLR
jgi:hypothetical protein